MLGLPSQPMELDLGKVVTHTWTLKGIYGREMFETWYAMSATEGYGALVMVDDSHAVGFMGPTGAGTPEHAGVSHRVDIHTGTFGKALGGASGGYVSGREAIVGEALQAAVVVNAAGAWADELAVISGVERVGLQPYRRTAAIVDVGHPLAPAVPMVAAADDSYYFRPEDGGVLISPAESVPSAPEDARPRPGDIDRLLGRLNQATTLDIRSVRRAWTGLRTSTADGVPVVGFDPRAAGFFWLAGQGGYGFQTSSAIAELAAALILAQGSAARSGPESRTAGLLSPARLSLRR